MSKPTFNITGQVVHIPEPEYISLSDKQFVLQRFIVRPHGMANYETPFSFQMKQRMTSEVAKYAKGDQVKVFFEIKPKLVAKTGTTVTYLEIYKIEPHTNED